MAIAPPSQKKTENEGEGFSSGFRQSPWSELSDDPYSLTEVVATFVGYLSKYKGPLARAFTAFFLAATLLAIIPLTAKFLIDSVFPSGNRLLLWITAAAVVTMFMLRSVINALGHSLLIHTSTQVVFELRRRIFEHLQLLHLAFYEHEQSSKLVSKLTSDAAAIQMLIQWTLPVFSFSAFTVVVSLTLMTALNPLMTGVALMVTPMYLLTSLFFRSQLRRRAREVRQRSTRVAGNLSEVITGVRIVKSFGMEDREKRRFVRMIRANLDYEIDLGTTNAFRINMLDFLTGVSLALVILFGGGAVLDGGLSIGDYVAFMLFVALLFTPLTQMSDLALQSSHARAGLERIMRLFEVQPKVVDREHARDIERIEGNVRFEDVSFAYEGDDMVLRELDLEAEAGEAVALVGPSGSGKSSIVNLLTRFYDPTDGRILIDGIDLRNLSLKSYRNRLGIVLQEPFLFSGTIFDNICYARGRATYEQVELAAEQANALDFINELPDKMETQVGERGELLSGGERQRIAIARALLKDPDILILDEATSSLDSQSEALVQQALDRLMRGRTVFIIAHRLSTIRDADKIVVLNEGSIVETGDHEALVAKGGLYASLYARDAPGAVLEDLFHAHREDRGAGTEKWQPRH